jgi:purine-binding chemotaxis protein CheW
MDNLSVKSGEKGQLVTFLLGRETYGIEISKIQEVIHFQAITHIPNSPAFVEGVIRVRDRVIPVVDLKKRLGITGESEAKKRIVILDLEDRCLGVIVDDISKVLVLEDANYEALPEAVVGDRENTCIARLAKLDQELIIVVSPERILSKAERRVLREFEESPQREQV